MHLFWSVCNFGFKLLFKLGYQYEQASRDKNQDQRFYLVYVLRIVVCLLFCHFQNE